jgi:hypothetical protein
MIDITHQFVIVCLLLFLCNLIEIIPLRFRRSNNEHFNIPPNKIKRPLSWTATCFGLNRPKSGYQNNALKTRWKCNTYRIHHIQSGMLQRTILQRTNATTKSFINKIRILQRTQMLQRTRRNTIGRRSTRVRMACLAFPLWFERQSSTVSPFERFGYQFSSVICAFKSENIYLTFLIYNFSHEPAK